MKAAQLFLALLLAAPCLPVAADTAHLQVPPGSGFDEVKIADARMLEGRVTKLAAARVVAMFHASGCSKPAMTLYAKPGRPRMVLASDCLHLVAPAAGNEPERREIEYGMMMVIDGDDVQRLAKLDQFAFMYESGRLFAVTDLDHDGHLELWLSGTVYECGEGEDRCDSEGETVIEEADGAVREFDPSRWLARPPGR